MFSYKGDGYVLAVSRNRTTPLTELHFVCKVKVCKSQTSLHLGFKMSDVNRCPN